MLLVAEQMLVSDQSWLMFLMWNTAEYLATVIIIVITAVMIWRWPLSPGRITTRQTPTKHQLAIYACCMCNYYHCCMCNVNLLFPANKADNHIMWSSGRNQEPSKHCSLEIKTNKHWICITSPINRDLYGKKRASSSYWSVIILSIMRPPRLP